MLLGSKIVPLVLQNTSHIQLNQNRLFEGQTTCQSTTVVLAVYPTTLTASNGSVSTSYSLSPVTENVLTKTIRPAFATSSKPASAHGLSSRPEFTTEDPDSDTPLASSSVSLSPWTTLSRSTSRSTQVITSAPSNAAAVTLGQAPDPAIDGSTSKTTLTDSLMTRISQPVNTASGTGFSPPNENVSFPFGTEGSTRTDGSISIVPTTSSTRDQTSLDSSFASLADSSLVFTPTLGLSSSDATAIQIPASPTFVRTSSGAGVISSSASESSDAIPTTNPVYSCPRDNGMYYSDMNDRVYQLLCNTDELDSTISEDYQTDMQACVDACGYVSGCAGVSYVESSGICSYRSISLNRVGSSTTHSAVLANYVCPSADGTRLVDPMGSVYKVYCDTFFPLSSNITNSIAAVDLASCSEICSGMSECSGFTFENGACTLVSNRNSNDGVAMTNVATAILLARRIAQVAPIGSAPFRSTSIVGSVATAVTRTQIPTSAIISPDTSIRAESDTLLSAPQNAPTASSGDSSLLTSTASGYQFISSSFISASTGMNLATNAASQGSSAISQLVSGSSSGSVTVQTSGSLASSATSRMASLNSLSGTLQAPFSSSLTRVEPTPSSSNSVSIPRAVPTILSGLQSPTIPGSSTRAQAVTASSSGTFGSTAFGSSVSFSIRSQATTITGTIISRLTTQASGSILTVSSSASVPNGVRTISSNSFASVDTAALSSIRSSAINSAVSIINRPTSPQGGSSLMASSSLRPSASSNVQTVSSMTTLRTSVSLSSTSQTFVPNSETSSVLRSDMAGQSMSPSSISRNIVSIIGSSRTFTSAGFGSSEPNAYDTFSRSTSVISGVTSSAASVIGQTSSSPTFGISGVVSSFAYSTSGSMPLPESSGIESMSTSVRLIPSFSSTVSGTSAIVTLSETGGITVSSSRFSARTSGSGASNDFASSIVPTASSGNSQATFVSNDFVSSNTASFISSSISAPIVSTPSSVIQSDPRSGVQTLSTPSIEASSGTSVVPVSSDESSSGSASSSHTMNTPRASSANISPTTNLVASTIDVDVTGAEASSALPTLASFASSTTGAITDPTSMTNRPASSLSEGSLTSNAASTVDTVSFPMTSTHNAPSITCSAGGSVLDVCVDATITPSIGVGGGVGAGFSTSSSTPTILDASVSLGVNPSLAGSADIGISTGQSNAGAGARTTTTTPASNSGTPFSNGPTSTTSLPASCYNGGNILDFCLSAAITPSVGVGVASGSSTQTLLEVSATVNIAPSATAGVDVGLSVDSSGLSLGASATVAINPGLGSLNSITTSSSRTTTSSRTATPTCSPGGNALNVCIDVSATPSVGVGANANVGFGPSSSALTLLSASATIGLAPSVAAGVDVGLSIGSSGIGVNPSATLGVDLNLSAGVGVGVGGGGTRSSSSSSTMTRGTSTASTATTTTTRAQLPASLLRFATVVLPSKGKASS